MNENLLLRNATVQEIQLELIRRTSFIAFDGERFFASLVKRPDLWTAVMLDQPGVAYYAEPGFLLLGGLIKLRDLPDNLWNADKLWLLTPTRAAAQEWSRIAEEEDWGGEVSIYDDQREMDSALGMGRREYGLLSIWWD
jgi:hypothetical protein